MKLLTFYSIIFHVLLLIFLPGVSEILPLGIKDVVNAGEFPIVWSNKSYRMIYLNIGHGDREYTDATQNLLIVNAFRWIVSRDPKGNPFE